MAQRWSNFDKTTKLNRNPFYGQLLMIGPMLARCCSTNEILLANFGVNITRALRWPDVVQPTCAILYVGSTLAQCCKAIKVKGTDFQFSSNTRWCWPNVVHPTPTISQRYNGLPTFAHLPIVSGFDYSKPSAYWFVFNRSVVCEDEVYYEFTCFLSHRQYEEVDCCGLVY